MTELTGDTATKNPRISTPLSTLTIKLIHLIPNIVSKIKCKLHICSKMGSCFLSPYQRRLLFVSLWCKNPNRVSKNTIFPEYWNWHIYINIPRKFESCVICQYCVYVKILGEGSTSKTQLPNSVWTKQTLEFGNSSYVKTKNRKVSDLKA